MITYLRLKNNSTFSAWQCTPFQIPIEISPVLRDYNNCYIMLLNSPQVLENTGFVAGELSLIVSLVLYRPTSVYEL